MKLKIDINTSYPFYTEYNNTSYIVSHDCRKVVSLQEPRESRKYELSNPNGKELVVYKIDGGIINNNEEWKCDYGILSEENELFLIELKGANLSHAIKQINSTISLLLKQRKHIAVKGIYVRIILSKVPVPQLIETQEKKLRLLLKEYGCGDYHKKSRLLKETI